MTKSDLIDVLCETQKMPKGRAELLINVIFDSMEASLRRGERIEIRGFGSFEIRNYRAYEGRNPRTGTAVNVRPKRLPFFKVGKELKERVNDGGSPSGAAAGTGSTTTPKSKVGAGGGGGGDGIPGVTRQAATGPVAEGEGSSNSAPANSGTNRAATA
jgi:integration host factor subunit beta